MKTLIFFLIKIIDYLYNLISKYILLFVLYFFPRINMSKNYKFILINIRWDKYLEFKEYIIIY